MRLRNIKAGVVKQVYALSDIIDCIMGHVEERAGSIGQVAMMKLAGCTGAEDMGPHRCFAAFGDTHFILFKASSSLDLQGVDTVDVGWSYRQHAEVLQREISEFPNGLGPIVVSNAGNYEIHIHRQRGLPGAVFPQVQIYAHFNDNRRKGYEYWAFSPSGHLVIRRLERDVRKPHELPIIYKQE